MGRRLLACFGKGSGSSGGAKETQAHEKNATADVSAEEMRRGGAVLVELFSSQGCKTSPEAEILVSRLGRGDFELGVPPPLSDLSLSFNLCYFFLKNFRFFVMATLQKVKLLATQCAVAGSPTRSPTASPVIHLRRRKTLRMLLNRRRFPRQDNDDLGREVADELPEIKNKKIRAKLKDLFVSSPPFEERDSESSGSGDRQGLLPVTGTVGSGSATRRGSAGSLRPVSATFRYRLLRRAWRPMLVTIPE